MTTTELPGGNRRVVSVETNPSKGEVTIVLDGLFVRGAAMPKGRAVFAHDVRHQTRELMDAHLTLWHILSGALLDCGVLYVDIPETDGNNVVVLGIAPAREHHAFGMLFGMEYLINYLRSGAGVDPIGDAELAHARLTDPGSQPNLGWNAANKAMLGMLAHDLLIAFNLLIDADAP